MTDIQKENKSGGKVPNLRFPSFEGEWEVKKLGEIAEKIGDGLHGTPSYTDESNYYFINGNNLINGKIEITENTKKIDAKTFLKNDKNLRKNTLLISINGTIGNIAKYNNENVMLGKSVGYFNFEENSDFLYFVLQTSPVQEHFKSELTGSTIKNLSLKTLRETNLRLPSQDEQQKVASFLSLIDERITTQSKIINDLKTLKTATAKKIFSQEFRFKDDKGNDFSEWEEILLGEVMSIPEKTKAQNIDKNKLLTVKLHLKGVLKNDNTDTLSFGATNYFIRKKGQFIYGKQNLFNGAFDIIPDEFDGFLSSGDVPTLEINNSKINSSFLLYLMGRKEFYKPLEDFATGSGSKRIHEKTLLGIKIPFPSLPEQTKIANFLSAIDSKIDMETQLLQKLEEQKKFLLQNMFV